MALQTHHLDYASLSLPTTELLLVLVYVCVM